MVQKRMNVCLDTPYALSHGELLCDVKGTAYLYLELSQGMRESKVGIKNITAERIIFTDCINIYKNIYKIKNKKR